MAKEVEGDDEAGKAESIVVFVVPKVKACFPVAVAP
jgi:hypothetical protein